MWVWDSAGYSEKNLREISRYTIKSFLCSVMSMSGCIAPVTDRYAFAQFKEESNAMQSEAEDAG